MADLLFDDLKLQLRSGRAAVIVGAGVSIGATANAPCASWVGLLDDGIRRCEALFGSSLRPGWSNARRDCLQSGDVEEMLSTAELITRTLGKGEFSRWLRETVGSLPLHQDRVIRALGQLGVPMLTTNYDLLLEQGTGLPPVTWQEEARVERAIRGEDRAVVHLHGCWNSPESVVLGVRSYDTLVTAQHPQAVIRALRTLSTLVFVGCGDTLKDPNLGGLLRWSREAFAGSEYRHFRLSRTGEVTVVQREHPPAERIFVIPFGERHEDLAPFLEQFVVEGSKQVQAPRPAPTPLSLAVPLKDWVVTRWDAAAAGHVHPTWAELGAGGVYQPVDANAKVRSLLEQERLALVVGHAGAGKSVFAMEARLVPPERHLALLHGLYADRYGTLPPVVTTSFPPSPDSELPATPEQEDGAAALMFRLEAVRLAFLADVAVPGRGRREKRRPSSSRRSPPSRSSALGERSRRRGCSQSTAGRQFPVERPSRPESPRSPRQRCHRRGVVPSTRPQETSVLRGPLAGSAAAGSATLELAHREVRLRLGPRCEHRVSDRPTAAIGRRWREPGVPALWPGRARPGARPAQRRRAGGAIGHQRNMWWHHVA